MPRLARFVWVAVLAACGGEAATSPTADSVPTAIELSTTSLTFAALGEAKPLSATITDQQGAVLTRVELRWASSNPQVASVSSGGIVTAVDNGDAEITATAGAATADASVAVRQVVDSLSVSFASTRVERLGDAIDFSIDAFDALGSPVAEDPVLTTSDPLILALAGDSSVVGLRRGWADLTVELGGLSSTTEVDIDNWVLAAEAVASRPGQVGPWTVSRLDGSAPWVLGDAGSVPEADDVLWPTWHPSGDRLAVVVGSPNETVVLDANTHAVQDRFPYAPGRTVESQAWSPGGDTLGVLLRRELPSTIVFEFSVVTGTSLGAVQAVVAADTFHLAPVGCGGSYRALLGWDDQGRMSAVRFEPCRDDYREALVAVDPGDGSITVLHGVRDGSIEHVAWSPDHALVGLSGFAANGTPGSEFSLVLRADDLEVVGSDPSTTLTRGIAWDPAGERVAHSFAEQIRVLRPDGTLIGSYPRPGEAGTILGYDWDPSGRWLMVSCLAPRGTADFTLLWLLRPETGESRVLRLTGASMVDAPRWRP